MKALVGAFVALAFFYVFYSGVMAVWSYIQIDGVVDKAWEDQGRNGPTAVHAAILNGAAEAGVPVDARFVVVGEDEREVSVAVRWSFPAVTYKGESLIDIPLSVQRTYEKRP